MSSVHACRGVVAIGAIVAAANAQTAKPIEDSRPPESVRTGAPDMSWLRPANPAAPGDAATPPARAEKPAGGAREPAGNGARGLGTCSDGSGLNVDVNWGLLGPGAKIVISNTTGFGAGICGYSYFGAPLGFVEAYGEIVYQFTVDRRLVPSVDNFEGIFVGTDQDHYLLNGTFSFNSSDINGWGIASGRVADDCVGFVDEDGPMLSWNGVQPVLVPGLNYYFVVDSYDATGPFDIDFVLDLAPCSDGSGINVDFVSGVLPAGSYAAISDTTFYGAGVCGYSYFGAPFPYLATGSEIVVSFQVNERTTPSIVNYEGIFVGTDQDHYILDGLFAFNSSDIFGYGEGAGLIADDCVGFVDEQGTFLNAFSAPTVLYAGVTYYLIIDSYNLDNGPFDIDLVLAPAPCNGVDYAFPAGVLDFSDVFFFLVAFGGLNPVADLAPPFGVFDFSDVFAFLVAFGDGCP